MFPVMTKVSVSILRCIACKLSERQQAEILLCRAKMVQNEPGPVAAQTLMIRRRNHVKRRQAASVSSVKRGELKAAVIKRLEEERREGEANAVAQHDGSSTEAVAGRDADPI
jgi:hypothetical protein